MIYQPPLSSDGGRIKFYRYFPRMKPSVGIGLTSPFVRLDHFFSDSPDLITRLASPGTSVIIYMISGNALVIRDERKHDLSAGSAVMVKSTEGVATSITTPAGPGKSEGILIEFHEHAQVTAEDLTTVDPAALPAYESEESRELRIAGKWGGIETNGFMAISLFEYHARSTFRVVKPGPNIMILVLGGWISSGHENILKDQILISEEASSIDCRKGSRLLVLSGGEGLVPANSTRSTVS